MQKNEILATHNIDLSVVIISLSTDKYHTKVQLEVALKSMAPALKKINSEVIVVDNSTVDDGTSGIAKKYIKDVIYLKRNSVYSFCDNNNFGLKHARGRYVLFLNNDVEIIDENIFKEMVIWMDKNPDVGASSSALLNPDRKTLQASGGAFPSMFRVFAWMTFLDNIPLWEKIINSYHPKLDYYTKKHDQDWITGAFYLVRKDVLDKVGAFDQDFGAYVEEVDLSYRIKKAGFKIMYLPDWKIIHFGGLSYGNENSLILELKNLSLFYKKHYPTWQLPILNIVIKLGCILRVMVFTIFRPESVKIYAKAFKTI